MRPKFWVTNSPSSKKVTFFQLCGEEDAILLKTFLSLFKFVKRPHSSRQMLSRRVLEFVILSAVDSMSYTPSKFVFSNYFFEIEDCLQSIWLLSCYKLIDWLIRPLWSCAYGSENCPEEWSNSWQQRQLQIAKECCSDCHTRNQLCCPKEEVFLLPKEAVVRVLWLPCNLMWGTGNKEVLLPPRRIGIRGN